MSATPIHLQPHARGHQRRSRRHWPRRIAVGTLSISSLLVGFSALAYRSFVDLPI
jgi:hypothetical protein